MSSLGWDYVFSLETESGITLKSTLINNLYKAENQTAQNFSMCVFPCQEGKPIKHIKKKKENA